MIEDVIHTVENCRYCLMCRHVCPVGHVTRLETLTPHGWGLTIASIRRGITEINESSINVIYSCADCGTCQANCVTDQPLPSAIAAMRAEIAGKSKAPSIAYELQEKLEAWENPYGPRPESESGRGDTALYIGDDAHFLAPQAIEAILKLLEAIGVRPVLIGTGRSNGYLASSLGFPDLAAALADRTLQELEASGAARMLVISPGDFYVFARLHEERHGVSFPQNVRLLEVLPLLASQLEEGELKFRKSSQNGDYAYIDPTHSVRVPTRFEAPRQLLTAVQSSPPKELFWRRERAHPSGNGALQFTQPQIANHLAYSRLDDAANTGVRVAYTEDPGSENHLNKYSARFGVEIRNLYEFLAEQLLQ